MSISYTIQTEGRAAEYPTTHPLSASQRAAYDESNQELARAQCAFHSLRHTRWSWLYWKDLKSSYEKVMALRQMPHYTDPDLIDTLLIAAEDIRQAWMKYRLFGKQLVPFDGTYRMGQVNADGAHIAMTQLRDTAHANALLAYQEQFKGERALDLFAEPNHNLSYSPNHAKSDGNGIELQDVFMGRLIGILLLPILVPMQLILQSLPGVIKRTEDTLAKVNARLEVYDSPLIFLLHLRNEFGTPEEKTSISKQEEAWLRTLQPQMVQTIEKLKWRKAHGMFWL
jgi:hypothetical protein